LSDQFLDVFSHDFHEEVWACNICLGCDVPNNRDSSSRLASDIDQAVWLLFSNMLVLILLPMVIDYFYGYTRAFCLDIVAQIKNYRRTCVSIYRLVM
jgi:hypothetical protein